MSVLGIPRRLGHIWVGHRPPPTDWLVTWKEHHPDWDYVLYDNAYLTSRRWRNQALINEYFRRGRYEGVSDLIRYEILHETGGFLAEADVVCLRPCDTLFPEATLYTAYENELVKPGLVQPFLASAPGHSFLDHIISNLGRRYFDPSTLKIPWRSTGNRYLKFQIDRLRPSITIFPSHYFAPNHKSGNRHEPSDEIYGDHLWGTTRQAYGSYLPARAKRIRRRVLAALDAIQDMEAAA